VRISNTNADVVDRGDFFETPIGKLDLEFEKVLNIMCDLGWREITVSTNKIEETEFEWETLNSIVNKIKKRKNRKKCGAIAIFVGFVREINEGRKVKYLEYEINEELYYERLSKLKRELESREGIEGVEIFHKKGVVKVGEDIVYVAVMGYSRKHVFPVLAEAVERIKKELPIWKKEVFEGGEIWI